jgi:hypothetical protein
MVEPLPASVRPCDQSPVPHKKKKEENEKEKIHSLLSGSFVV